MALKLEAGQDIQYISTGNPEEFVEDKKNRLINIEVQWHKIKYIKRRKNCIF